MWYTTILAVLALGGTPVALAESGKLNESNQPTFVECGALSGHRYRVLVSTDIGRWRKEFLHDFAERMQRCRNPRP